MAACGLMLTSCDQVKTEVEVFEISIKNPSVASGKGQQFVNVKCGGDWTLALVAETGEVDWARLSVTSGTGNKRMIRIQAEIMDQATTAQETTVPETTAQEMQTFLQQAGLNSLLLTILTWDTMPIISR